VTDTRIADVGDAAAAGALVAVTCAHNEVDSLSPLVDSMLAQSRPPDRWVVVDDGSTDGTAELLACAARRVPFLHVVRRETEGRRSFSSKVDAFERGWSVARREDVTFLACIDADVTLPPDFFERVVGAFSTRPELGVTGGRYVERSRGRLQEDYADRRQLPGCAQVFRRVTYEEIGGYQRLPHGGEDTMANVAARARGWETEAPPGLTVEHRRSRFELPLRDALRAQVRQGRCDHDVGTLWWFELLKMARRLTEPPVVIGVATRFGAYVWAGVTRAPRHASHEVIAAWRDEQRARIRR
jgi:poly-beta-1,6-N-acetyl-D-glucosamine synthase